MAMVYVPAGEFEMGSTDAQIEAVLEDCPKCGSDWFDHEQPAHTVYLDGFWVDQTEVSNAQYRRCVETGVCSPPTECEWGETAFGDAAFADHPVTCVSWDAARSYCLWVGGQLPSEAQWEKAARGTDGRLYPWGDAFDGALVNYCDAQCGFEQMDQAYDDGFAKTAPVGSFPAAVSPYGALDMAGNVWEWVFDWYDDLYYGKSPERNPGGPNAGAHRVVRGGSWYTNRAGVRTAYRFHTEPGSVYGLLGFRCVVNPWD
jgi:formylglycine-generating enzyme required for sulfatase activity